MRKCLCCNMQRELYAVRRECSLSQKCFSAVEGVATSCASVLVLLRTALSLLWGLLVLHAIVFCTFLRLGFVCAVFCLCLLLVRTMMQHMLHARKNCVFKVL